jgi:hypothetical protein
MVEHKKRVHSEQMKKRDNDKKTDPKDPKEKINDLDYLDWIFNHGWQRVKKGGFG